MRFLLSRQQVRLVIGAVMLLLIQGLLAPGRPGRDATISFVRMVSNTGHL